MAIKLTAESFLAGVRQSGLIDSDRLDERLRQLEKSGLNVTDSMEIAAALVNAGDITDWQSEKLLQGKFKGFMLGRYRLMRLLGRGEMSSIYLAEHVRMKRRCAIKVLPASKVKDTSYLGRFHREAEAVAALDHPNIVRAYDVDMEVEAGTEIHFLAMEYVDGIDLEKLREKEELSIIQAVDYIRQGAEGLAHAHGAGLIHRDIKPGNLLVDRKGIVKLLDLGLARFFNQNEEESLTIKHDEKVLGTADYLAPEQAVDSHSVDARADIYSLGCTLYFALAGQPPFTDGTLVQRLLAHQTKAPTPVNKLRSDVPESLVTILDKMMRKSKEERYQTAQEVAQELGRWLVQNAGAEWCKAHPELVAQFAGLDSLKAALAPIAPVSPTIKRPVPPGSDVIPASASDSVRKRRKVERSRPQSVVNSISAATPMPPSKMVEEPQIPVRVSPASFRQPLPPPKTFAEFLQYHQIWVIAAAVMLAVLMVAGVGYTLQAKSDEETNQVPIQSPDIPEQGLR